MANHTVSSLPFLYGRNLVTGKCQRVKKNALRKAPILRSSSLPSHRDTLFSSYVMASEGPLGTWGPSHAHRGMISGLQGTKMTWTVPPIGTGSWLVTPRKARVPTPLWLPKGRLMLFLSHSSSSWWCRYFTILSLCLPPLPHTSKCTVGDFSHSTSSPGAFFNR